MSAVSLEVEGSALEDWPRNAQTVNLALLCYCGTIIGMKAKAPYAFKLSTNSIHT